MRPKFFAPPFDQKIKSAQNTHKTWKNCLLETLKKNDDPPTKIVTPHADK